MLDVLANFIKELSQLTWAILLKLVFKVQKLNLVYWGRMLGVLDKRRQEGQFVSESEWEAVPESYWMHSLAFCSEIWRLES